VNSPQIYAGEGAGKMTQEIATIVTIQAVTVSCRVTDGSGNKNKNASPEAGVIAATNN
jgi:hypothetical protein